MIKRKGTLRLNGQSVLFIKDIFEIMKEQAKERCIGKTEVFTWENGIMISIMDGVRSR